MLRDSISRLSDNKDISDRSGKSNQSIPVLFTDTIVGHQTPVLFSTNRGLFLRKVHQVNGAGNSAGTSSCNYDLNFCDLERWSTNRANSVCLNDTINSQTYSLGNQNRPSVRFVTEAYDITENYGKESAIN